MKNWCVDYVHLCSLVKTHPAQLPVPERNIADNLFFVIIGRLETASQPFKMVQPRLLGFARQIGPDGWMHARFNLAETFQRHLKSRQDRMPAR